MTSADKKVLEMVQNAVNPVQESMWEEYSYDLTVMKDEDYVFDGFLGEGITSAAGAAGVGKTNMLVTVTARATGFIGSYGDFLVPRLKRKVIYITEHAAQVERILAGLARHVDKRVGSAEFKEWFTVFNAEQLAPFIITSRIKSLIPQKTVTQTVLIGDVQVKPLIVFDTVAANFDILNENDNSEVGKYVNELRSVALGSKCPIITSGHTSKANKRGDWKDLSNRGASSFEANVTTTSFMFKDEAGDSNVRYWKLDKTRYIPEFDEVCFRAVHHSTETIDQCGYPRTMFYFHLEVEQSSEALRASARIEQAVSGMQDPIVEFIGEKWTALRDGEEGAIPPTKTSIRKMFGKSNATDKAVASLVNRGLILLVKKGEERWESSVTPLSINNSIKEVYLLPERGAYDYK